MPLATGNPFLDAIGGNRWANPFVNITFDDGGAWTGLEINAFQTWSNVANIDWGFGWSQAAAISSSHSGTLLVRDATMNARISPSCLMCDRKAAGGNCNDYFV